MKTGRSDESHARSPTREVNDSSVRSLSLMGRGRHVRTGPNLYPLRGSAAAILIVRATAEELLTRKST